MNMEKLDENNDLDQKKELTPLGVEEMNNMIKSFQNSSFNEEEIFQKETKTFVKKTLYELAIESNEKEESYSNSSQADDIETNKEISANSENALEQKDIQLDDDKKEEGLKEVKEPSDIKNSGDEHEPNENQENTSESPLNTNDINNSKEQEINKEDSEKIENETLDIGAQENEKNLVEGEQESTLEALDSVREAVSKSLEKHEEGNLEKQEVAGHEKSETTFEAEGNKTEDIQLKFDEIENLFDDIKKVSVEEIEKTIKEKVVEISTEIAGYQIDKLPQKFLQKIKIVLDDLAVINDQVSIVLNKEDLKAINKIELEMGKRITFEENENLDRGEFSINSGGLLHSINYKKIK